MCLLHQKDYVSILFIAMRPASQRVRVLFGHGQVHVALPLIHAREVLAAGRLDRFHVRALPLTSHKCI